MLWISIKSYLIYYLLFLSQYGQFVFLNGMKMLISVVIGFVVMLIVGIGIVNIFMAVCKTIKNRDRTFFRYGLYFNLIFLLLFFYLHIPLLHLCHFLLCLVLLSFLWECSLYSFSRFRLHSLLLFLLLFSF